MNPVILPSHAIALTYRLAMSEKVSRVQGQTSKETRGRGKGQHECGQPSAWVSEHFDSKSYEAQW